MPTTDAPWLIRLKTALKPGCYIERRDRKTRVQIVRNGRKETRVLDIKLTADNSALLLETCLDLKERFERGESIRIKAEQPTRKTAFSLVWRQAITAFRDDLSRTTQANEKTREGYAEMVERSLVQMESEGVEATARHLLAAAATLWPTQHRKRHEAVRCIALFCAFAVEELKWDGSTWTPSNRALDAHRGAKHSRREVATPTDQELLDVINAQPQEEWRNVLAMMATYGLRPIEVWGCIVRPHPEKFTLQMRVEHQKSSGQHKNPKRWVYPALLMGEDGHVDFKLPDRMADDELPLPEYDKWATKDALADNPVWQRLYKKYDRMGLWLRPYSFRNSYNRRLKSCISNEELRHLSMGHTAETNRRFYENLKEQDLLDALE